MAVADVHLSHRPPKFRRDEPNWYAAMARTLGQVADVLNTYRVPLVYAGDVFDDGWRTSRCPPELINFAISHLPRGYAVPGQHDLPHHRYEDVRRSAYWTLVEAGVLTDLPPGPPVLTGELALYGFPWGTETGPRGFEVGNTFTTHLAVAHRYAWVAGCSYTLAPREQYADCYAQDMAGFDAVVFGDNHRGFTHRKVCNPGTLMRRHSDDLTSGHRPGVGLLLRGGGWRLLHLDTAQDAYAASEPNAVPGRPAKVSDASAFVGGLDSLGGGCVDFRAVLKERASRGDPAVAAVVDRVLGR